MGGLVSVGYFLFSLVFSLLLFLLWGRVFLRYFRVSSLNPISQIFHKLTNPFVFLFDKLLNKKSSFRSQYDWAALLCILVVELFKFILLGIISFGGIMPIEYLFIYIVADLIKEPINLMFYAIIIRVIASWVNPSSHHPALELIYLITEPLLSKARQVIPSFSGLDFSPFLLLVCITIINIFIDGILPIGLN